MAQIILNAAGGTSGYVNESLQPGGRYLFWWVSNDINDGRVNVQEGSPMGHAIPFFSDLVSGDPVGFDVTLANSGRLEFTAATEQFQISVTGSVANAGATIEYGITRIAR